MVAYWNCFWLLAFAVALLSSESFLQAFIVVQGLFTERNLVQALSLPLVDVSSLDVFRARSISFDGPPTEAWYGRQSTHHSPLPVASPRRTSFPSASWTRASCSIRSVSHRDVSPRLSRGSTCACPRARRGHVHRRHPVLCRRFLVRGSISDPMGSDRTLKRKPTRPSSNPAFLSIERKGGATANRVPFGIEPESGSNEKPT